MQQSDASAQRPVMSLDGIGKSFSGVPALTDVSLTIHAGEVHALLGENGAGKSTLMNVATGSLIPDSGTITVGDETFSSLTPTQATALGIAIVHQHPAVLPDLTVLENLRVALPSSVFAGRPAADVARELLGRVRLNVHLADRVENLSVAQKHLLEIAKALAVHPKVLVLDEPTAPLGSEAVAMLFDLVAEWTAEGTAIVYITHRMAEVRQLAQRVSVLRDGHVARADADISDVTDDELLSLIVGRRLASAFPDKHPANDDAPNLVIEHLSAEGVHDVSFSAKPGEIIGIAGVVGNGQEELMRALAGLAPHEGSVVIDGQELSAKALLSSSGYMPADRHHEGLIMRLTVRENAAIAALKRFRKGPGLSKRAELDLVTEQLRSLAVKAPSLDAEVSALSGGNQQKVVMARTVLARPKLVLAHEPTQGVDVGARAELYRIIREISAQGTPVIVASSDAKELEGLCDRVIVLSRGQVVADLVGDDIQEDRMVHTAVSSKTETLTAVNARPGGTSRLSRFLQGDYAPVLLLGVVIIGLAGYILGLNDKYLNAFNVTSVLTLTTALGFIALGQTMALLLGGIDMSVGPLAGMLVVIASFYFSGGAQVASMLLGLAAMILVSIATGLVNGLLIRYLKFTAIAATLAVYFALQGFSFILRPTPGGNIDTAVSDVIQFKVFGMIPVAFLLLLVCTAGLEFALKKSIWGWKLRATGSDEANARRVGVKINRTVISAYIFASLLTFLGALMLMAQLGVGDASQGVNYTLTSVTAVVLGGTSLFGGRGTFVGSLLGALLLTQVLNAMFFLKLDQSWQYYLQGLMILVAAVVYSVVRARVKNRVAAS
ncbi:ATP-binding cassette domain-containing protein [Leucobacter rhizosphaerae]|uniref:ATP-binding cassette domain-containing protein n=1 Tax=Leucobacter rhizosphaerae TaxID=2932245 RepID=A0ABY4FSI1_9MICO|nr:ATP-binding cassette domain-containing protein [Leucobacter rhizosphaerae]UOQ59217.1 ATP-binding cassette domain-containing protein [Leucobacter rhizosphaerae]